METRARGARRARCEKRAGCQTRWKRDAPDARRAGSETRRMPDALDAPEKLNGCLHLRILHLESTIISCFVEFDSIFGNTNQGLLAQYYFSGLYWQKIEHFCRKPRKMVASICEFCIWSQPQHFLRAERPGDYLWFLHLESTAALFGGWWPVAGCRLPVAYPLRYSLNRLTARGAVAESRKTKQISRVAGTSSSLVIIR